jgi:uncharacterized protein YceH (UPF0502 family)
MEPLSPDEARVLGVLIEKQMTTPDQYPLTINALVSGAGQKNNRNPIFEVDEEWVYAAADALRAKGLAVRVEQSGARVAKHKHVATEKLGCRPAELALLAELLLRGPQTAGELRSRASRMQAFESLADVEGFLRSLMDRPEPLVRRLPPAAGTRAEKYAQLLSPDAHPIDATGPTAGGGGADTATAGGRVEVVETAADPSLADRVTRLEAEVDVLRAALRQLAQAVGADDPFPGARV